MWLLLLLELTGKLQYYANKISRTWTNISVILLMSILSTVTQITLWMQYFYSAVLRDVNTFDPGRLMLFRPASACGGRCGAAEEPLSQQGVRRRRRRRRSNRTPTRTATPGRSERSGAGGSSTGQRSDQRSHTEEQQLRSGGAEAEAPVLPAGLWLF